MSIFKSDRKSFLYIALAAMLAIGLPVAAQAADAHKEIATASDHAGYAASADTVGKVHLHLHHVINCLVGPHGKDFDKQAGNPCAGQGDGALNDLDSGMADEKASLDNALALARTGVKMTSLSAAQNVATTVKNILDKAK